jgi:hypothetical protein
VSNENWKRNDIQFARLIAEIAMVAPSMPTLVEHLGESMDLSLDQVYELFDRGTKVWEKNKLNTDHDTCLCCGSWGATDNGDDDDT